MAELVASWQLILGGFVAVLGGRAAVVFLVTGLLARTSEEYGGRIRAVEAQLSELPSPQGHLRGEAAPRTKRRLVMLEKNELVETFHHDALGRDAY